MRTARALERGRGRIDAGDQCPLLGEASSERAVAAAQVEQPALAAAGVMQARLEQAQDVLVCLGCRVPGRQLPPDLVVNAQAMRR